MVRDDRDLGKQIKRFLPEPVFRGLTVAFNAMTRCIPFHLKYAVGAFLRKRRAPYCFLKPDDVVVQVGSARDILHTGRSRPILLSRMVPQGHVIVIEADEQNCDELEQVVDRYRIKNIEVIRSGVWSEQTTLRFLSSDRHPAANLIEDAKQVSDRDMHQRGYTVQFINVDTIDNILESFDVLHPAMVSITTNGAELTAVQGLVRTIQRGCPYICLAATGSGFEEAMAKVGYRYVARDDRGYCYVQNREVVLSDRKTGARRAG